MEESTSGGRKFLHPDFAKPRLNLHLHLELKLTLPNTEAANLKLVPAARPNLTQVYLLRRSPSQDHQDSEENCVNAHHVEVKEASRGGRCPGEEARRRG